MFKSGSISAIILVLSIGCSRSPVSKTKAPDAPKVTLISKNIILRPGKVKLIEFPFYSQIHKTLYCSNGSSHKLFKSQNKIKGYLVESYFSDLKPYECFLSYNGVQEKVFNVSVKPYPYKSERLYVNKRRVTLSKKDQRRAIREQKMLNKIYAASAKNPYFDEQFKTPLSSYITSYYGARRVFNGKKKTQHLGTDYRARVGVPIKSTNRGKVVFAGNLFYTGNAVIVDHGLGIFTVYGHLSKISAKVGELVMKGSLLGHSGRTGRVSGPHLHWGVKIAGHWVDGLSLVKEGI